MVRGSKGGKGKHMRESQRDTSMGKEAWKIQS